MPIIEPAQQVTQHGRLACYKTNMAILRNEDNTLVLFKAINPSRNSNILFIVLLIPEEYIINNNVNSLLYKPEIFNKIMNLKTSVYSITHKI